MSDHVVYYVATDAGPLAELSVAEIEDAALRWFVLGAALGLAADADPNALAQELREARTGVRELAF